jgi:DNA-directed RNA polymerase beta' subunit
LSQKKTLTLYPKFERIITMITANTPESIDRFRLVALKSALKLETLGMKRRGQSAYSIVKQELGLKGNKESVLKQLEAKIKEIKNDG